MVQASLRQAALRPDALRQAALRTLPCARGFAASCLAHADLQQSRLRILTCRKLPCSECLRAHHLHRRLACAPRDERRAGMQVSLRLIACGTRGEHHGIRVAHRRTKVQRRVVFSCAASPAASL